ncbi:leukotriene B4 receptor 1-like isoform X2 [Polyodon spathula]|uniref:leukotriene B4 receptor 1-like isoform X2 n=1 Tax=Polyodon spathula TaxID=7913 RepID=UPI001B7EC525|nr:leukotriene B4 receptor 1-like isoform X2 [Polyodon spathula]
MRILIPNCIPDQRETMNFSSSSPPSLPPQPPPSSPGFSQILGAVILILAFVLGFPGNLFVVWTVLCRVTRRSVTCLLVLNLAAADALVLLSAPFFMRYVIGGRGWEFGTVFCKLVHYLCSINMYASIFLITTMSLDRFLAVSRPFLSQQLRTKKVLLKTLLVIWSLAFLFAIPMPFYRSVFPKGGLFYCIPFHSDPKHMVFQYLMETIFGFLIPFAIIAFCYTYVGLRLRNAMFQRKGKGSRIILLIVAVFVVFWMPYHIVNLIQVSSALAWEESLKEALLNAAKTARPNVTAFAFFSSSINPILYVFVGSSHIRSAGLNFMAKMFEGTYSEGSGSRRFSRSTRSTRSGSLEATSLRKISLKPVKDKRQGRDVERAGMMAELRRVCTTDEKETGNQSSS